jgi:hypothetical protein
MAYNVDNIKKVKIINNISNKEIAKIEGYYSGIVFAPSGELAAIVVAATVTNIEFP